MWAIVPVQFPVDHPQSPPSPPIVPNHGPKDTRGIASTRKANEEVVWCTRPTNSIPHWLGVVVGVVGVVGVACGIAFCFLFGPVVLFGFCVQQEIERKGDDCRRLLVVTGVSIDLVLSNPLYSLIYIFYSIHKTPESMKDRVEPNRTTTTTTTPSSSTSPGRRRGRRRHVVVVGAGLAGLVCAHTLLEESAAATEAEQDNGPSQSQSQQQQQSPEEPAALHVTLVEASDRVGGRIAMDDDFCPGLPLDLGAEYITLVDSHNHNHNANHNNAKNDHDPSSTSHSAAGGMDEPLLTQYIQEFQAMGLLPTIHHPNKNIKTAHDQPQNIPPVAVPPKPVAPSTKEVVVASGDHASNASSDSSSSISLSFSQPPSLPLPTKQQPQPPSPPQAKGLLAATLAQPTSSLLSLGMKNNNHTTREAASVNDDGSIVIFNVLDQSSNNNNNNKDGSKSSSKDPKTERPSLLTTLSSTSLGASRRTLTAPPTNPPSHYHHAHNLYSGTTTSIATTTTTSGSQVDGCSISSMLDVERFPNHDSFHNSMDLNVHLNDSAAGSLFDPYLGHYVAEEDEEEEDDEDDEDTDKEATNQATTTRRMDPTVYQPVFATAAATHCCSSNSSPGTTRSGHYGRYFCNGKLVSAHEASTVVPLTQTLDQLFFQPATTITTTTINAESPQDGSIHTASLDPNLSLEQAFGMAGTTSTLKTPMARKLTHKKHVTATSSTASAASAQSTTKTGLAPSLYKLCLASLGNAVGCTDFSDLSFAMMRLQQQAQRHYDDNHEHNGSATGEWSMYRLAPPLTMYSVVEALLQLLTQHPRYKDRFTLRLNAPVTQIKTVPQPSSQSSSRSAGLCLKIQQQQQSTDSQQVSLLHADHVVVSVPPTVLSRILPNILPSKKMEALNYIGYTSTLVTRMVLCCLLFRG